VSVAAYENVRLREWVDTEFVCEFKWGFVEAVVSRAVRFWECPLRELLLYSTRSPVKHFLLFSLFNAFQEEWHEILKTNKNSISSRTHDLIQTDFMTVLFLRYPVYQQRKRNITKLSARTYPVKLEKDIFTALQNNIGY